MFVSDSWAFLFILWPKVVLGVLGRLNNAAEVTCSDQSACVCVCSRKAPCIVVIHRNNASVRASVSNEFPMRLNFWGTAGWPCWRLMLCQSLDIVVCRDTSDNVVTLSGQWPRWPSGPIRPTWSVYASLTNAASQQSFTTLSVTQLMKHSSDTHALKPSQSFLADSIYLW